MGVVWNAIVGVVRRAVRRHEGVVPFPPTAEEVAFIEMLRIHKVLQPVNKRWLPRDASGVICVMCGDASHATKHVARHAIIAQGVCGRDHIHLLTENGGAIRGSQTANRPHLRQWAEQHSPEMRERLLAADRAVPDQMILRVCDSADLKGINTIILDLHCPCGQARAWGMKGSEMVDAVFEFKSILRRFRPDLQVVCSLQFYDGRRRTIEILNRLAWQRHRSQVLDAEKRHAYAAAA